MSDTEEGGEHLLVPVILEGMMAEDETNEDDDSIRHRMVCYLAKKIAKMSTVIDSQCSPNFSRI